MAKLSLQEQMLKAGLVNEKKLKKADLFLVETNTSLYHTEFFLHLGFFKQKLKLTCWPEI